MKRPAALAAAAFTFACASPTPPGEPLDLAPPLADDDPRVVRLAGDLAAAADDRQSLVASAELSVASPEIRLSRPYRLALRRPGSLRVEILGLFDQVAAILATDGARYQLYDPALPEIEEGRARPGLLWQVARIDLEPDEAIDLLLGAPLAERSVLEGAGEGEDGRILIGFRDAVAGGRRIFEFDGGARLSRVRHRVAGDFLVWEADYDDYRAVGDRSFAHRIEVRFPHQDARAAFRFRAVELNRPLPESVFVLPRTVP